MQDDLSQYYKILGLEPGVSLDEIKQAYRDLVKVWHPDRFSHDTRLQLKAQEKLKEVNKAYKNLYAVYEYTHTRTSQPRSETSQSQPNYETSYTEENTYQSQTEFHTSDEYGKTKSNKGLSWIVVVIALVLSIVFVKSRESDDYYEPESVKTTFKKPTEVSVKSPAIESEIKEIVPTKNKSIQAKTSTSKQKSDSSSLAKNEKENSINVESSSKKLRKEPLMTEKTESPPSRDYFLVGSHKNEVLVIQGEPDRKEGLAWYYGESSVTISKNRVISFDNKGNLKVNDTKAANKTNPIAQPQKDFFTSGSTIEDVLAIQGEPERKSGNVWYYGSSFVTVLDGKVISFTNYGNLKVKYGGKVANGIAPAKPLSNYFTIGSIQEDVLTLQGQPDKKLGLAWFYGDSTVTIHQGKVIRFENKGNLKVKEHPTKQIESNSPSVLQVKHFTIGSTKKEVKAIQGIPTKMELNRWWYGKSCVVFKKKRVVGWSSSPDFPLKARRN